MHITEKLESISKYETVFEINKMLDNAHVSINWWGQRMVTIQGYEGCVEINKLAEKYLYNKVLDINETDIHLQERVNCYELWGRVDELYTHSDEALKRTWLFKYLVPLKEFLFSSQAKVYIMDSSKKNLCFAFPPQEFQSRWPDTQQQISCRVNGKTIVRSIATLEMVKTALAKQYGLSYP